MTFAVEDLRVSYGRGRRRSEVVHGVDLLVADGTTMGLVGESGCGKSSVARALVGVGDITGVVVVDGTRHDLSNPRACRALRRRVQLVFQNPTASLNPRLAVWESVADGVRARRRRDGADAAGPPLGAEVDGLLAMVGLEDVPRGAHPHELSGGQRQRVALARALGAKPDVLIADEISSALDVSVQAQVLNLLHELQAEVGFSCLFISHDLAAVRHVSTSVAVMYLGSVVETGDCRHVLAAPEHPYTASLMASSRLGEPGTALVGEATDATHPPSGCGFHPRCPHGPTLRADRAVCAETAPLLDGSGDRTVGGVACHFPMRAEPTA